MRNINNRDNLVGGRRGGPVTPKGGEEEEAKSTEGKRILEDGGTHGVLKKTRGSS